jgi:DNA-dependent RNA polymerase auxiliary subunit epsilon
VLQFSQENLDALPVDVFTDSLYHRDEIGQDANEDVDEAPFQKPLDERLLDEENIQEEYTP